MNKKVLTVCAALLLSSSSFVFASDYVATSFSANWQTTLEKFDKQGIDWVISDGNRVGMTLQEDIDFKDERNFLLIDVDNFVLDGNGKTWHGHIVVTGENVTIKDLTIEYTNAFTREEGNDGTKLETKSAIAVFASSVKLINNTINCHENSYNYMTNGISIVPLSSNPEFVITGNTINDAKAIVAGDDTWPAAPSFGIQIVGGVQSDSNNNGFTYFTTKEGGSSPKKAPTNIDFSKSIIEDNKIYNSATDYAYIDVTGDVTAEKTDVEIYKDVVVSPIVDEKTGEVTNAAAIEKAIKNADVTASVTFNGDAHLLAEAVQNADLDGANVAVKCDDIYVTYGEATAPEGEPAISVDGQGQASSIPLTYHKDLADGKEATNLLVVNNQEVKAYRAEGETTSTVSLSNYNPSNNTEEGENRAELYQWTFSVEATNDGEYKMYLVDNYGQKLTVKDTNGTDRWAYVDIDIDENDGKFTFTQNGQTLPADTYPKKYVLKVSDTEYVYVNANNELDTQTLFGNEFGAGSVDVARIQAGYLLQRFGDHFTLEITYEDKDENEFDLTSIFEGELAPMKNVYYRDGKAYYDKADGWMKEFMLVNEDGEILAVNTNEEDRLSIGKVNHVYPLTTISPRQWANDQAVGGDHIYATMFRFEYEPGQNASDVQAITKIQAYVEGEWIDLGCYYDRINGQLTPTLAAADGAELIETNLTIKLNASSVVLNPASWLTQPVYYTVTVKNSNKKAEHYGEILGLNEDGIVDYVDPAKTDQAKPEGQFAIDFTDANNDGEAEYYTFTNRETGKADSYRLAADRLYKIDATTFAYLHGNHMDTLAIEPVKDFTSEDGFVRFTADELNANTYNVAMDVINGPLYVVENHNDRHRIGLDAEEATDWRIEMSTVKVLDAAKDEVAIVPDTVTISTPIRYYVNPTIGWITTEGNTGKKAIYNDPNTALKVPTYVFLNTATSEYISGSEDKEETANDYYYCPSKTSATRFALKEVGDSTVNLVPVTNNYTTGYGIHRVEYNTWNNDIELTESQYYDKKDGTKGYASNLELSSNKVIGGTSVATGVLHDVDLYAANDNDLFVISETGAPTYKPLEQGDNIIISMLNNTDNVLYEDGEFANIDNRKIGMNPALYIDTAYVNRPGNYRYEYLLGVNILYTDTIDACNNPNHDHLRTTFSEGRYLVNMRDSMEANEDVHVNKFAYDNEPKLAFMPGYHQNDTLYLTNEAGEVISKSFLGNSAPHFAKFAFKMIDEEANEFIVEVGNEAAEQYVLNNRGDWTVIKSEPTRGYLRWHNDNLVVTNNIDNAAHFTMEETDLIATSNEEISAEEGTISVTAVDGAVIIKGAAGKNVVIATILGKVVANETINSDNETIAVPAGIAVVSVDGESFKVVVK